MFSFGRQNGMRAILALVLALVPLVGVLMLFPQLGDQVPMKVGWCISASTCRRSAFGVGTARRAGKAAARD